MAKLLDVVEGRDADSLIPVFQRLKRARAPLEAIAIDLSPAYRRAVREYAPAGVRIVHDPFHCVQMVNRAVDAVRRREQNRLEEEEGKRVIKGSRYLLLGAGEKRETDQSKMSKLSSLLALNENLNKAYMLKEDFRLLGGRKTSRQQVPFWMRG